MKYVTRRDRFEAGDYPMVCVRSGLPATEMVPVVARRTSVWPFFLLPYSLILFALGKLFADVGTIPGALPVADGHIDGISATYERPIGVIIKGVHPNFVEATKAAQGRT